MVLPEEVQHAAANGQLDTIKDWLESGNNDVNEVDSDGASLLYHCCLELSAHEGHVSVIEYLLSRGADVNLPDEHCSLLHVAAVRQSQSPRKIVELLLGAGIQVDARDNSGTDATPIAWVISNFCMIDGARGNLSSEGLKNLVKCCIMLLRAGASLDAIGRPGPGGEQKSVEDHVNCQLETCEDLEDNEDVIAFQATVAELRAAGSWRQYVLAPPKDLLRLRSLIARGRATVRPHGWTPSCVARLFARSLPNEIAWRILEYWNPRY